MKYKLTLFFYAAILIAAFPNQVFSQISTIIVYETFEIFQEDKGTIYEGKYKISSTSPGGKITFRNNGKNAKEVKKVKVKLKNSWGFKLDGKLFRIVKKDNKFNSSHNIHYLRSKGKVCYYENGLAIINMLCSEGSVDLDLLRYGQSSGAFVSVSKSINSEVYSFSGKYDAKKTVKKMPELQEVYNCIFPAKYKFVLEKTRKCFDYYNQD